ncbi:MAG: LTA synthase family protein [Ruminococcus sp.]|jgi:phosphoglycerol transferase MdoB-like AlkP superfamily enzyme|nr:LTA synthase family protein [Ruminococcus sp.]
MKKNKTSLKEKIVKTKENFIRLDKKLLANNAKHKDFGIFLLIFFPFFICAIAEINQGKSLTKFFNFVYYSPSIMIFNVLVAGMVLLVFLGLFKRGFWAVLAQSVLYFGLSTIELFKFNTNGNHLILTDMRLAKSAKSLTSFAYIKITPELCILAAIVLLYIWLVFWYHPVFKVKWQKRIAASVVLCLIMVVTVRTPVLSDPIYRVFGISTDRASNAFRQNEKFDNNSFLAFFIQTTTESYENKIEEPEVYDFEKTEDVVLDAGNTPAEDDFNAVTPNVIVIMSESYSDFREFENLEIPISDAYDGFDDVAQEGFSGKAVSPTFASFTVRTEFELNFGLPVRSINDPNMPQRLLEKEPQPTIARYYKEKLGYQAAYIHPFLNTFYSRSTKYPFFGFDRLVFRDEFDIPEDYFNLYISDKVVFDQAQLVLENNEKPTFIHCTTMQNHQPYNWDDEMTEFETYLTGIKESSEALRNLTDELKDFDEPTVVLFVGDHFPSMRGEDGIYEQLGINSENCASVYMQNYIIWANYDLDYSNIPDERVSMFYLPYIVLDTIGAPIDDYMKVIYDQIDENPIYSTGYDDTTEKNEVLDLITYDRILGDKWSYPGLEVADDAENDDGS